jgi:RNA polymerase sigma-70 factor (ECF subfamily)
VLQQLGAAGTAGDPPERLIPRIASGDQSAFERFYDLHSPTVYGLLLKITSDPSDASDLLQETFLQVWQNASRYDASRGSEIAWLITIARSRAIDRLRSRNTRSTREDESAREVFSTGTPVDQVNVEGDIVLKEMHDIVREAMQELPPEQRRVLEMAYFEGKSQSEIAAQLSQPLGSVKTRVQLGMKKLRARLTPRFRL